MSWMSRSCRQVLCNRDSQQGVSSTSWVSMLLCPPTWGTNNSQREKDYSTHYKPTAAVLKCFKKVFSENNKHPANNHVCFVKKRCLLMGSLMHGNDKSGCSSENVFVVMEHETHLSRPGWCKTWQNKSSVMSSSWSSKEILSSPWSQNNDYSSWVSYLAFHINKFMTVRPQFLLDVYLSVLYLMCGFYYMCSRMSKVFCCL